ncbi:MAG: hypothetical protein KAR32_06055, partial [Candidatus Omnitrophica bacterium]|nr:hypothetical protein [Candidatus Omnitrophota bacterium]
DGLSYTGVIATGVSDTASPCTWKVGVSFTGTNCGTEGASGTSEELVIGSFDRNEKIKIKIHKSNDSTIVDCTSTSCDDTDKTSSITIQKRFRSVNLGATTLIVDDNGADPDITWVTDGYITGPPSVNLFFAIDGTTFASPIQIGGDEQDVSGYSAWTVPTEAIGETTRIRVASAAFPDDVYGVSSQDLIVKGAIDSIFPVGGAAATEDGDVLVVGKDTGATGIQYAKHGNIGNLKIEYIHSGCATDLLISPDPLGTNEAIAFPWTVTDVDGCGGSVIDIGLARSSKIRMTGLTHEANANLKATETTTDVTGTIEMFFRIRGDLYDAEPGLTASEVYLIGDTTYIKWKSRGEIGNVKITADLNSGKGDDDAIGGSDDYTVGLTGPDSAEPDADLLAYDYDGGAGAGSWLWTIPDAPSQTYKIRVESTSNPVDPVAGPGGDDMETYADSAQTFTIRGSVTLTAPNGPQAPQWKTGETKSITWDNTGDIGNVKLWLYYELDTDIAGGTYEQSLEIIDSTSGGGGSNGSYPWDIPGTLSTERAVVTITALGDPGATHTPDADFKIKPILDFTYPNQLTDEIVVGELENLTWATPVGDASTIKINVSTDGTTWNDELPTYANSGGLVVDPATAGNEIYNNWEVPDIMSNTAKIRMCKNHLAIRGGGVDTETCDESGQFNIIGSISNVYVKVSSGDDPPSAPITLPIDIDKWITWDYKGNLGNVNIYYTANANDATPTWTIIPDPDDTGPRTSGANVPIDDGSAGDKGSYQWMVPNAPSTDVRVKIVNVHDDAWKDIETLSCSTGADCTNNIIGSIVDVTVVAGGNPSTTDMEVQGTGDTTSKTIRWKPNGNITLFDIQYRVDGDSWVTPAITGGSGVAGAVDTDPNYRVWPWNNIP